MMIIWMPRLFHIILAEQNGSGSFVRMIGHHQRPLLFMVECGRRQWEKWLHMCYLSFTVTLLPHIQIMYRELFKRL